MQMSAWRRKAIENFPVLQQDLNDPEFTIYMLFFELLPMSREAHRHGRTRELEKIYRFAEWCAAQHDDNLQNAAAVAFYEHLFDERELWEKVAPWLGSQFIRRYWPLWEYQLDVEQLKALRKFLGRKAP